MPMTVVVTRNSSGRIRGFLSSCMCEIAPGVYTAPRLSVAVRERVWRVMKSWFEPSRDMAIVMTWPDNAVPGGQVIRCIGVPRTELWDYYGVTLARRHLGDEAQAPVERVGANEEG
jgi:CRISPR-associated protein Cas2